MKDLSSPVGGLGQGKSASALNNSSQMMRGEELDLTQFQSEGGASVHAQSEISYEYGGNSRRGAGDPTLQGQDAP